MATPLQVGTFVSDVTPPLGAPLCYGYVKPAASVTDPLTCRGIVLLCDPKPVVLCAVDWLGIAHEGYAQWRSALAAAAGTEPSRVLLHTVHQHNATAYDPSAAAMLERGSMHDDAHVQAAIAGAAAAVRVARRRTITATHLTAGAAPVEQVASNRRILGPDGKVAHMRLSSCRDPALRAEPEGLIDPLVRVIGFWDGDEPLVRLSWYATHPQSYYNDGAVTWDFPGIARQATQGMAHVHFTGAAGNVAAGKYNDGSPENRPLLAQRLAAGIERAWQAGERAGHREIDSSTFDLRASSRSYCP